MPVITFPTANFQYQVNETFPVTFQCSATGTPLSYINWLLNGSRLEDLPGYSSRVSLGNASQPVLVETGGGTIYSVTRSLTLSATMDDDSGTYSCEAFNNNTRAPSITQDFELFVRGNHNDPLSSALSYLVLLPLSLTSCSSDYHHP